MLALQVEYGNRIMIEFTLHCFFTGISSTWLALTWSQWDLLNKNNRLEYSHIVMDHTASMTAVSVITKISNVITKLHEQTHICQWEKRAILITKNKCHNLKQSGCLVSVLFLLLSSLQTLEDSFVCVSFPISWSDRLEIHSMLQLFCHKKNWVSATISSFVEAIHYNVLYT